MFGIGFFELLLICVISLLILGPTRLPQFITTVEELFIKSRNGINRLKQEFYSEGFEKREERKKVCEEKMYLARLGLSVSITDIIDAGVPKSIPRFPTQLELPLAWKAHVIREPSSEVSVQCTNPMRYQLSTKKKWKILLEWEDSAGIRTMALIWLGEN